MRELKFRAWDKEEKEYYYNAEYTYDFCCSGRGCYAESFGEVLNQPERFIVEQYTGLKDKNGKDIYEGDIVRQSGSNLICPVEFKYGGFVPFTSDMMTFDNDYCEVIGNIHENKELWR